MSFSVTVFSLMQPNKEGRDVQGLCTSEGRVAFYKKKKLS